MIQVPLVEFSIFWMIVTFYGGIHAVLDEDDPSNLASCFTLDLVISILFPLFLIFFLIQIIQLSFRFLATFILSKQNVLRVVLNSFVCIKMNQEAKFNQAWEQSLKKNNFHLKRELR